MLVRKFVSETIVLTIEHIHGFNGTKTSYWYVDTSNWLKNQFGKEFDPIDYPMTESDIDWFKRVTLPKAIPFTKQED